MIGIALLAGIGFFEPAMAVWNEGLHMDCTIETGYIEPVFDEYGNLIVTDNQLHIEAISTANTELKYDFVIKNQGTVPVKIVPSEYYLDHFWVTITPEDSNKSAYLNESVKGTISIHILQDAALGDHYLDLLDLKINCIQWNGDPGEVERWWNQPLQVVGKITVIEPITVGFESTSDITETETGNPVSEPTSDISDTENDLTEQQVTSEIEEVAE